MKKISAELLRKDFLLLRESLSKNHPGIYRYRTKNEIDHIFDSCMNSIRDSMTVPEFYALTRFAIAGMEDGHSNCKLPRNVAEDFVSGIPVFPAMVLFINGHAYIFCCKQNPSLAGCEIISINNQPCNVIIEKLFGYIPSDAGISSRKNWELPEFFHLLYYAIYGPQQQFVITYKSSDQSIQKITLRADIIKNIFCENPFPAPGKYLALSYPTSDIAILQVKTFLDFFLERSGENFYQFLDSAFRDIKTKQAKKLIIDLRRNQGGNDANGALLYSFVALKEFKYYKSLETVDRKINVSDDSLLGTLHPQPNRFDGKLFILTDGRSFSASSEFSSAVKSNHRGLFLGEENGGGYYGNTSGNDSTLVLPNTQINCRVPLVKYTLDVRDLPKHSLGILPDFPLYPSMQDIIAKKDGVILLAIAFAQKN